MATDTEAIEALIALGLTEYEARCFVALSHLSQGTAKEISRVADVPQSRVYDVTDQLHQRGLVDIEESDPRRYIALPTDGAIDRLQREFSSHLETANDALQDLDSREREEDGAWTIANRKDIVTRIKMHVDNGTAEVYLHLAHEDLLEETVYEALEGAAERELDVYVEVPSESVRTKIHERVPAARVAVSDLPLDTLGVHERVPGRLLMVDRETVLLSAQKEGLVPGQVDETGLWGSQVGHGLVAWIRPLLGARLDKLEFTSAR